MTTIQQTTSEAIKEGIRMYAFILGANHEPINGIQFSDLCRNNYDYQNKINAFYYSLFERYIISIRTKGGVIYCKLSNYDLLNIK